MGRGPPTSGPPTLSWERTISNCGGEDWQIKEGAERESCYVWAERLSLKSELVSELKTTSAVPHGLLSGCRSKDQRPECVDRHPHSRLSWHWRSQASNTNILELNPCLELPIA